MSDVRDIRPLPPAPALPPRPRDQQGSRKPAPHPPEADKEGPPGHDDSDPNHVDEYA